MRELQQVATTDAMYRDTTVCSSSHVYDFIRLQGSDIGQVSLDQDMCMLVTMMNFLMSSPQAMAYSRCTNQVSLLCRPRIT